MSSSSEPAVTVGGRKSQVVSPPERKISGAPLLKSLPNLKFKLDPRGQRKKKKFAEGRSNGRKGGQLPSASPPPPRPRPKLGKQREIIPECIGVPEYRLSPDLLKGFESRRLKNFTFRQDFKAYEYERWWKFSP
ncbi:hypothetical protein RUM44_001606 [Polyplax serrata]|uniref:Uncharacterized protein n=1 Tax=Polyplax serrata TaxID=468196 RepID=A0ABR1AKQ7_POLSC